MDIYLGIFTYSLMGFVCAVGHELIALRPDADTRILWFFFWPALLVGWGVNRGIKVCAKCIDDLLDRLDKKTGA